MKWGVKGWPNPPNLGLYTDRCLRSGGGDSGFAGEVMGVVCRFAGIAEAGEAGR